jgi:hypothetical protein
MRVFSHWTASKPCNERSKSMKSLALTPAKTATVAMLTAGMYASLLVAPPAQAASLAPTVAGSVVADLGLRSAELESALGLLAEIPDEVLIAGDAALAAWMNATHPELAKTARADVVGCVGAIAILIASTAFPAAKILKIKSLIGALGGVTKAVQLFWGASFKWEKIRALGGAAAALGAELLGISAVKQKCFS